MVPLTIWISNKDRVETLKAEFDWRYPEGSPLTITEESDGGFRIDIAEVKAIDLLHFFHAGIEHGLKVSRKYS